MFQEALILGIQNNKKPTIKASIKCLYLLKILSCAGSDKFTVEFL